MKNPLLKQLLECMSMDIEEAFEDREGDILEAIQKLREDQDDEKPIVFSVGFSGKLNLDKNKIETAFSYSVKTVVKNGHNIQDPDQSELPWSQ